MANARSLPRMRFLLVLQGRVGERIPRIVPVESLTAVPIFLPPLLVHQYVFCAAGGFAYTMSRLGLEFRVI